MTIGVRLIAAGSDQEFHHFPGPHTREPVFIVMSPGEAHAHFKTATRTTLGTTVVVQPREGQAIWITDIIVSGEKQAGSNITVQFTDGTNTEIIAIVDQVDAAPNLAMNLNSYFRGWIDARIEIVTGGAGDGTVTIGYIHAHEALAFDVWDAER